MIQFSERLPIDDALPALTAALRQSHAAVLVAPPGAGKTTRVPLVLIDEPWAAGKKILVLEPRRLAARAAADRMAATLKESVGETVGLRVRFGSKVSRKTRIEVVTEGIFTRLILDDPSLDGIAAVLFDEFHERSLDADLGLALARDVQLGLRDDLKLLAMSATLDGARVAKLLGDAPVVESEGRAFAGRDALSRPRHPRAHRASGRRCGGAGATRRAGLGAGVPAGAGGNPPHRNAAEGADRRSRDRRGDALRRARRADPGSRDFARAQRQAQGGACHVHRRNLAHHPGRAHRRRWRACARAALRARCRRHPAGDRARVARRSRSAPRPRRPHRARRLLPAVGRAADRVARSLCAAGNPRRRSVEPAARSGAMGHGRSRDARLSRSAARGRAHRSEGAAGRTWRDRRAGPHHRRGPQASQIAAAAAARPHGGGRSGAGARASAPPTSPRSCRSADLAATMSTCRIVSTSSAATARGAARTRGAWRSAGRTMPRAARPRTQRRNPICRPAPFSRSPIRTASPRAAAATARSCSPMAAAPIVDPASALAREPFLAVAELSGTAAQGRILLAASITLDEIEERFADRIENREEITFDTASASLRGRRSERLGAIALAERPLPAGSAPDAASKLAEGIVRIGLDRLPWSKPLQQWRDRVMFLRRAEGDEWPDLSDEGLAAGAAEWLAPMLDGKTALSQVGADELSTAIAVAAPLGSQAPPRRGGADAFLRAVRLVGADRLRGGGGAEALDPGAGAVRPRPASRHRPAARSRCWWNCCRRRTARCRSPATCRASGAAPTPR